jgi:hypothetical protein
MGRDCKQTAAGVIPTSLAPSEMLVETWLERIRIQHCSLGSLIQPKHVADASVTMQKL